VRPKKLANWQNWGVDKPITAFVLSGGGLLGSTQVGMLQALVEFGITPDLVLGASIGAINGAGFAQDPTPAGVNTLTQLWLDVAEQSPFSGSIVERVSTLAKTRVSLFESQNLEKLLSGQLHAQEIQDLPVKFGCVAVRIQDAREVWFESGPLVPAIMASSAAPGIYPPVKMSDGDYMDGGIVNPVPVDKARKLGANRIFVLQVGKMEQSLPIPTNPVSSALTALEIARRARFNAAVTKAEQTGEVHLLPTGSNTLLSVDRAAFDPREAKRVLNRMDSAYDATSKYLSKVFKQH
jgi:NTE family protein